MRFLTFALAVFVALGVTVGCSKKAAPSMKGNVEQALKQNGLDKINVDEDREKGVITLKGDVASDDDKARAEQVAKQAASGLVIANEIGVRPQGMESTAKKVESNTDDAIKDHFKATIAANRWENQHIGYDVKNGVLTLKGDVDTPQQKSEVEKAASSIPGVQQVVNELEVKGQKKKSKASGQ